MEMHHFTRLDVDKSQRLTWLEFQGSRLFNSGYHLDPADLFAKADANGDGTLERQEFDFLTNNNKFKEVDEVHM